MSATQTNWAGNLTYSASAVHRPHTVEDVVTIVRNAKRLRPLGTRHCFNGIADTTGESIAMDHLDHLLDLQPDRRRVTVDGGMRYGELGDYLHAHHFAIHNLASLPHISIAGAIATATHGSGIHNGCLAAAVTGMEFVDAEGKLRAYTHEHPSFNGMAVHLGALGVVTRVTLEVQPAFSVRQTVYEMLSLETLATHLDAVMGAGYSVSLFTEWRGNGLFQAWVKQRVTSESTAAPRDFFGAAAVDVDRHPLPGLSAEHCTPQRGVAGPWHERLPHFRMGFTPSGGEELQSEYFVPREHGMAALRAVNALRDRIHPLLLISEIRTIAADELWMSPFYKRESLAIHFTWKRDWSRVREVLPLIEHTLAPFHARPHWGKLFTMSPATLRSHYARLKDFQELARSFDPQGKFQNDFLRDYVLSNG